MEIKGLTVDAFTDILTRVSRDQYAGNLRLDYEPVRLNAAGTRFRLRIRAVSSRESGARRSASGRRMPAACWHAFRDVFIAVFDAYPDATVRTGMAVYRGRDGFHRDYPATGDVNIGSMVNWVTMPDLCECDDSDDHEVMPFTIPAPMTPTDPMDTASVIARMERAIQEAERDAPYEGYDMYTFRGSDMDTAPSVR